MGDLKTYLAAICGLVLGITTPLPAPAASPSQAEAELHLFASCTGRLSALREFQWNEDTRASEDTSRQMESLIQLLEATTTPTTAARALGWRIEAKAAQRSLLNEARYRKDPRLSAQARSVLAPCLRLTF